MFNVFDWMIQNHHQFSLSEPIVFYFIAQAHNENRDGCYDILEPEVLDIVSLLIQHRQILGMQVMIV